MRTWKNVELEKSEYEKFRTYLKEKNICYEPSACFNLVHVELFVDDKETEMLQQFLDRM